MANLAVNITVFICLLLLSNARSFSDQPENIVDLPESLTNLPDQSNPRTQTLVTLFFPRENLESETEPAEISTETKLPDGDPDTTTTEGIKSTSQFETERVPLTAATFRPINRHFIRRPLPLFRHRHPYRHHRQKLYQLKPWNPRVKGLEFPYGEDMILSGGEDTVFGPMRRGVDRRIPVRWTTFQDVGARFPGSRHDVEWREDMLRPHHHHHHDHEEGKQKQKGDGFMKGIRKFLEHHF